MKMEMSRKLWVVILSPVVALMASIGTKIALGAEYGLRRNYYSAAQLGAAYFVISIPVIMCGLSGMAIPAFRGLIDELLVRQYGGYLEDPVIKQRIRDSIDSYAYVLGVDTMKISDKMWAAILLIPYALCLALIATLIVVDDEKWGLPSACLAVLNVLVWIVLLCLRGIPILGLLYKCWQLINRLYGDDPVIEERILELKKKNSSDPTTGSKQD